MKRSPVVIAPQGVPRPDVEDAGMNVRLVGLLLLIVLGASLPTLSIDRRTFALDVLRRYAPDGYEVIERYEQTPWSYSLPGRSITMSKGDFMAFVRGEQPMDIVENLPTAVHEGCHNYSRKMVWYMLQAQRQPWRDSIALPIKKGEVLLITVTQTFPAARAADRIPASLRDFRFKTYVSPSNPNQTTQQMGVYGLLDEFNAYQNGARTAADLLGWYERETPRSGEAWLKHFQAFEGTYAARGQFKLFILAWLAEARERHKDIYRNFLANREAVRAFLRIDQEFEAIIRRYNAARPGLYARLRARGLQVTEDERGIRIGDRGIGTSTLEYRQAMAELSKPTYAALEKELRAAGRQ